MNACPAAGNTELLEFRAMRGKDTRAGAAAPPAQAASGGGCRGTTGGLHSRRPTAPHQRRCSDSRDTDAEGC